MPSVRSRSTTTSSRPAARPPASTSQSRRTDDTRFFSRYIDVPNSALFPFGYGLSYSSFSYNDVKVSKGSIPLAQASRPNRMPLLEATATVTNTGDRTATEVVQCYVRNLGASIEQPVRSLEGFRRVTLAPGESKQVSFPLGFNELSFFNLDEQADDRSDPLHGLDRRQFAGQPGSQLSKWFLPQGWRIRTDAQSGIVFR